MNTRYSILKNIPLVRFLIVLILGVTTGIYLQEKSYLLTAVIGLAVLLLSALVLRRTYRLDKLTKQALIVQYLLFTALFIVGFALSVLHNESLKQTHFSHYIADKALVSLQLIETPSEKAKSYKVLAELDSIYTDSATRHTSGKLLFYIEKNERASKLKYGDRITAAVYIKEIDDPKNPFEFNYKDYLKFHNIYHTSYISDENWTAKNKQAKTTIFAKIAALRIYLTEVIDQYIAGSQEKAIANAILIGKKDLLDKDTIRAYSSSGAMHVLAVSGLHVGIVYVVFNYLFFFLKNKRVRLLKPLILVLLIWFYAFLTGASPSVLRAATMFSFIAIGSSLKQYINIYNTIAASAFVLILINPYIVTEVGFQLSYFAVIGIIFLQPKIYNLFYAKNYVLDKVWAITAVSIAAQIATFPLGLLYFHQFPNFFWISNLIVIPAAFLIVYLGVALFFFSFSSFIASIIGFMLSKVIFFLNYAVGLIDQLPYSLSSGLHITLLESYFIYFIIIALSLAFSYKNKQALFAALVFIFFFTSSYTYNKLNTTKNSTLTIYHVPKQSAIEFNDGNERFSYFDKTLEENENQLLFRVKHNWWGRYTQNQNFMENDTSELLLKFKDKEVLIIDSNYNKPTSKIEVDYCILKHQKKLYLSSFVKQVEAEMYIFDSSNKSYYNKYWKKDCDSLNLNCYFVNEQEALIINF